MKVKDKEKSGLGALIRRIHFYGGLFVGPFLIVAALSGALYALAPTAESFAYRDILKVPEAESTVSLEEQVNNAAAEYPDMEISQVWPAPEPGDTTRVLLYSEDDEELEGSSLSRSIFVNPYNGDVVGDEITYSGLGELPLRYLFSQAHKNMFLGDPGRVYAELAASWMWFLALGGIYLWWKRTRSAKKMTFGYGKKQKNSRNRFMGWHGVAGVWLLVAMLGLSATGITWSLFAGNNVDTTVEAMNWKANPINTTLEDFEKAQQQSGSGHEGHGGGSSSSSPEAEPVDSETIAAQADQVYKTAREEGLTGSLRLFPPADNQSAWEASERWVNFRTTSDAIAVNGETGALVDRLDFADLPLFSKLSSWGIYLHMGIMFGLPLQLILFAVGIGIMALVIIGYVLWWKRRPTPGAPAGVPGPRTNLRVSDWIAIAAFLAIFGTFLPVLGVSLVAMLIVDRVIVARARKFPAARGAKKELEDNPEEFAVVPEDEAVTK